MTARQARSRILSRTLTVTGIGMSFSAGADADGVLGWD